VIALVVLLIYAITTPSNIVSQLDPNRMTSIQNSDANSEWFRKKSNTFFLDCKEIPHQHSQDKQYRDSKQREASSK